ncbi:dihydroorotase [Roseobacter sp. HKCCA0434]|uniref:dihydroorotase n=1 Tax=Roseobacter sp. HKCCA0434 TaxID=3079297 RepID=UPI002905DEA8|nr:dihydroorotase [Roseobacter sp. HKCCA0434]
MQQITLRRPDDWHLHLRDGPMLEGIVGESARDFARAIVMPNLVPPVVTRADALAYRDRIRAALGDDPFRPCMTLYLTEATDPDDVAAAAEDGLVTAVKLYPAGATTNSQSGVRDLGEVMPVLERMAAIGLPLCIHGEVTTPEVDIFDREAVFIETVLDPLRARLPELRITLEHVTTKDGVDYVREAEKNLACTLTTHHLVIDRNHMLVGGIRPHYYCLPIVKRAEHKRALRAAAVSGDARIFLGTDSAPHVDAAKETGCGCAGVFSATNTLPILAQVFEEDGALDRLEAFTSLNGAAWYGMDPNEATITLERSDDPVTFPARIETGAGPVTVFDPQMEIHWRVAR